MTRTTKTRAQLNGQSKPKQATTRVAIYTRKSVTEGLEQEFNTLDAQREAVEAFVLSQRGQGWVALSESYDDGGFTGANTDRPAFQRLLADAEASKIDVVAVYRTDRLSRSMLDFVKLMEFFQAQGVAFVSVTETFDTSTPMGRMVLNMLATFAQFERESIAQRTKDKMLASRRRGMWTGGRPVLGYDVMDKKLVVNEQEAEQVRQTFTLYLELGTLLAVVDELKRRGWETKTFTNKKGDTVHGQKFTKTSLHSLLTNPLYIGKVRAGDELADGAHEAVVDAETWRRVDKQLSDHGAGRANGRRRKNDALLAVLVYCACGSALTPHHTKKGDTRYAYYVCTRQQKEGARACPGSRVAMGELESFVVDQIRCIGRDPAVLEATLEADQRDRDARRPELVAEARNLRTERTRIGGERTNVVDAVATGGPATGVLMEKLADLDQDLGTVTGRLDGVTADLAALEAGLVDPDELHAALADLEPVWAELFPRERARVLSLLLERVEFDAEVGEVEITFRQGGPKAVNGRDREDSR